MNAFVRNKVASQKWHLAARLLFQYDNNERIDRHFSLAPNNIHTFALLCIDTMWNIASFTWFANEVDSVCAREKQKMRK